MDVDSRTFFSPRTLCRTLQTLPSTPLTIHYILPLCNAAFANPSAAQHNFLVFYVGSWHSILTYIQSCPRSTELKLSSSLWLILPSIEYFGTSRSLFSFSAPIAIGDVLIPTQRLRYVVDLYQWLRSLTTVVLSSKVIYSMDILVFKSLNYGVCHLYDFFCFTSTAAMSAFAKG